MACFECENNGLTNCTCSENCPTKTSDILTWDGQFANISVPADASLNDVLELIESYFYNLYLNNTSTTYTLAADSACLGLSAGSYSHTEMITAIVAVLCQNATDIDTLQAQVAALPAMNTTNVTLNGIVLPSCFSAFAGTTSTALFNEILTELCDLMNLEGPTTNPPIVVTPPDPGQTADPNFPSYGNRNQFAYYGSLGQVYDSLVDNHSFVWSHTNPHVDPASFVATIYTMKGVVEDYLVIRGSNEDFTVNASKDTYFFLNADGTINKIETALGAGQPATPSGTHELYKMVSDGSGITSVANLFETDPFGAVTIGAGAVDTAELADDSVTTAKLAHVATGATVGHSELIEFVFNDQGQVTSATTGLDLTGIANGYIMTYNSGTLRFEATANTNITTANVIPKANSGATDYEDSSLKEVTNQVEISKKTEINTGTPEDDAGALLNLVSTTQAFLIMRMTAAQAGAITAVNGMMLYVTSTDATFTSVGFWGYEGGAWTKL